MATYCVNTQHRAVLGQDRAEQLVAHVELLRAALQPSAGLAQVVGRVVADLLEPGEQREHQATAGVLVGALDALHRLAHQRLVEHHLLAGQPDHLVGLGLRRQLRGDAGVGLAAAQQERLDELGEPARDRGVDTALDRSRPHLAEGGARAEQPGRRPVEDRPQLGQVVLHRGAGQRDPAPRLDGAQVAGGRGGGVLDVLRLVGDDEVPRDRRRGLRGRAAWCRRSSARSRRRGPPRSRPVPWKRRTATPGANRWISFSQLPIRLAGQTTSVGPVASPRSAAVQVQRDQGDRLAQAHVVGQAGAEPGAGELGQPGEAVALVVAQRRIEARRVSPAGRRRRRRRCGRGPSPGSLRDAPRGRRRRGRACRSAPPAGRPPA